MNQDIEKIIQIILADANRRREDAGYSGRYDDGGADITEAEVKFYRYGLENKFPHEWEKYKLVLDPEYQEYQRLARKFGHK